MQCTIQRMAGWAAMAAGLVLLVAVAPAAEGQFRLFGPRADDDDLELEDRDDRPPAGLFAQLRVRRQMRRDFEAMEEYYDDLADYYEDRDPRLADYYERMEEYYEDLRDGRRVNPPLPPGAPRGARSGFAPGAPAPGTPGAGAPGAERWRPWGPTGPAAGEPVPSPRLERQPPAEGPRLAPPGQADGPPPAPTPPSPRNDPRVRLQQSFAALQDELRSLRVAGDADGTDWIAYLQLPPLGGGPPDGEQLEQLAAVLERYDQIAADPQYRLIARLPAFAPTRAALRQVVSGPQPEPTLAPPQADPAAAPTAEELPAPTPAEPK